MIMMYKRVLPQLLALLLLLLAMATAFGSIRAVAEDEPTPEPTAIPQEAVSPYRIVLMAPGGWCSNQQAVMKVSVTDKNSLGWHKIEYRMNDGGWIDCENEFVGGYAELSLQANGVFTLRMTDPHGHQFEESTEVKCIDLTAPVISASINGTMLQVDAKDDLSGVAGVQVNSMLFTALTNGALNVELDQNMNQFEKLAVRAFDYAGNFSEPVSLDNPHYVKPPEPTPMPTATAKPTKKPASADNEAVSTPSAAPAVTPFPTQNRHQGLGSSLIYVQDEPDPTPEPTAAPTPEPIIKTEYITIGPGMPYQADGNAHTLDVLYSAATNKQFITLQTKSGNTFYLVIDYDKPIDEEAELYETYFLNLVDERDLLALMSDEEKQIVIYGKSGHAEVLGLVGQTDGKAIVIEKAEEAKKLDLNKSIRLFSQTTKSLDEFQEIVEYFKQHISPEATFEYYDTICRQVANRMPKLREFAATHDLIFFVSGKKSSNGKMLFEECLKVNANSHLIDNEKEIDPSLLQNVKSIGVCGATSTPKWLMEKIYNHIRTLIKE